MYYMFIIGLLLLKIYRELPPLHDWGGTCKTIHKDLCEKILIDYSKDGVGSRYCAENVG